MSKTKKLFVLLMAVTMICTTLFGCAKSNTESQTTDESTEKSTTVESAVTESEETVSVEFVTLKIIYPGDCSKRMEEFEKNEMKTKLKDELNCEMKITWLPWTDYWNKKDMMLAAGEVIDWCWDGIGAINQMVAKKQTTPINDLLKEYGEDIYKNIPEKFFESVTIDGEIHGIPSTNCPSGANYQMVNIRQDMMKEVGMTGIKTTADLKLFAEKVQEKHPEMYGAADAVIRAIARDFQDQVYEFYGDSNIIAIGQTDNKVYSFYETEAYQEAAKFNRELSNAGILPDEVNIKLNESSARMASGNYLWGQASIGKPSEVLDTLRKVVPTGDYMAYLLNPSLGKYIAAPGGEVIIIPPTSKNPERAMMFLNWMLQSKENYMFMLYGVEGQDWALENGRLNTITPSDSFLHEWMFRNKSYQEFPASLSQEYIDKYLTWDDDAKYANCFGFAFDQTSVKAEYDNCYAVKGANFDPITNGFVDFDENYPAAVEALKKAGIDKLIDEYQKQFDAFLASKK